MNEIEKILKDNMEDYESVKRQALKFIHENKKELSKNYAYAEVCGNPVDASHFFFLIDEKKPGSDLLLEMLDYALKNYVSSEKASVTACIKGVNIWRRFPRQVTLSVIWFCQVLL